MSKPSASIVRSLYIQALRTKFGWVDGIDRALKSDVHLGSKSPGEWTNGILEIYCENGIPNASDIHSWPAMPEFGMSAGSHDNSDDWYEVDEIVNAELAIRGYSERINHEPYNAAVVGVYWS